MSTSDPPDAIQSDPRHVELSATHTSAALLVSPEFAPVILDALADGVVIYDAVGGIVGSNRTADAMFGFELPGRREAFAAPIEERKAAVELRTLEGQPLRHDERPAIRVLHGETLTGAQTMDVMARTLDGQERILNISGAPVHDASERVIGAVCVYRDITERKRLEQDLAERVAELEGIFATQTEGVALVARDGQVLRMNTAQRRLLEERGIDPEEKRIETWMQAAEPHDAQGRVVSQEALPYYRALRGETVAGEDAVEIYQRTQDGRDLVARVSAAPFCDERGRMLGVVVTTHDVTQQRLLERQRLAVMRMVAHDLGNPLAAIRLYIQMQQRRLALGLAPFTPDDSLLAQMDYGLTRAQRLLDDLSVATQVELGTLKLRRVRCDLVALCREEVAAQRAVSGRDIQFKAPDEAVWVEADAARIGQVIGNLLSNALKYSAGNQPVNAGVTVELAIGEPGQARVSVQDAGPGIPEQEQRRIFEQFYRVASVEPQDGRGGLGLGLFIGKGIVEGHGGHIGVESRVGTGSTFWFTLPVVDGAGQDQQA